MLSRQVHFCRKLAVIRLASEEARRSPFKPPRHLWHAPRKKGLKFLLKNQLFFVKYLYFENEFYRNIKVWKIAQNLSCKCILFKCNSKVKIFSKSLKIFYLRKKSPKIRTLQDKYDVLGVEPWVNADELKQAYLERVKENHPDRPRGKILQRFFENISFSRTNSNGTYKYEKQLRL